jgi:DNA-binding SARP family transcriptional activator
VSHQASDAATASSFAPPVAGELVRRRVVELLDDRWAAQVVLLEAPGGFGKTVALAQSYRRNLRDPLGVDVVASCGPAERDAERLATLIASGFEFQLPRSASTVEELAGVIATGLSHLGPAAVCLMLDDVHVLEDHDESTALLGHLLRALPGNAHLLLSGRRIPKLPLARLDAADQVLRIDAAQLCFNAEELTAISARHGSDAPTLESTGGWPALVRLSLAVDRSAPIDFLLQEVVDGLDHPHRRALATAVLAGGVDDEAIATIAGADVDVATLVRAVPLMTEWPDGSVRPHDLWRPIVSELLDRDELRSIAVAVAEHQLGQGRHDDALETAAGVQAWGPARTAVVAAMRSSQRTLRASTAARWLDAFPSEQRGTPELLLLECAMHRMRGHWEAARDAAEAALELATATGDLELEALAALEIGTISWLTDDVHRLLGVLEISARLESAGIASLRWMLDLAGAGLADLSGDPAQALELVEGIDVDAVPPRVAQLVMRWRCVLPVLLGDTERAVAHAAVLAERDPGPMTSLLVGATLWQDGDPEPFRARVASGESSLLQEVAQDDFLTGAYGALIGTSVDLIEPVDHLEALASARSRDRALLHIARAAAAVARGDEDAARHQIDELLAGGAEDPVIWGELARCVGLCAPLSSVVSARLAQTELGPMLRRRRDLADLAIAARGGHEVDWNLLPAPPEVMTGLPLHWSLTLAARAADDGRADLASDLALYLFDFVGPSVHEILEELDSEWAADLEGVMAVRAMLPPPGQATVSISVCGPTTVAGTGASTDVLRRARARELLAMLVLRDRWTTDQAVQALWPGSSAERGRANLRTTLYYLRDLLEPGRPRGAPAHLVRRDDDQIRLVRSSSLQVDLWDIRRHLDVGRELERIGHVADAVDEFRAAVSFWTAELLGDLRDHHTLGAEVAFVELELARAAAQVAEWDLASGDSGSAAAVAERLLRHDPYDERAHAVVVASLLDRGDLVEAGRALDRCRSALRELGVEPSPATALLVRRFERLAQAG